MSNSPTTEVRFEWIGEGWKMFTEQWKGWVTISLGVFVAVVLPMLAFMIVMYLAMFVAMLDQPHSRGAPAQMPLATMLFLYLGIFGLIIVLMPLAAFLIGGAYKAAFKQLRGGRVEFRDLFSARDCYWRLLGATLLHTLLVFIGAMLCVIPGFIVAGLLFFTLPLIVDRNLGVFDAMRASRDVVQRNLLMFTLFAVVVQFLVSAGAYACYVGLLVTWPLMFTITVVAYRDCFGVEGARSFQQAAPPSNRDYGAPPLHSAPIPEPQAIACPNCQTSVPAAARFCPNCGTSFSA